MTGRGNYDAKYKRAVQVGEYPKITTRVTISTMPQKLEYNSVWPFYNVVASPNPLGRPITFYTFFNCSSQLEAGSLEVDATIDEQHEYRNAPTIMGEPREDFCLVTESKADFEIV